MSSCILGLTKLGPGKAQPFNSHRVTLFHVDFPCRLYVSLQNGHVIFPFPFSQGDIRNKDEVEKALTGVDCVYHVASYGMSGREQVSKGHI